VIFIYIDIKNHSSKVALISFQLLPKRKEPSSTARMGPTVFARH